MPQKALSSDCLVIPTITEVAAVVKYTRQLRNKDELVRVELEFSDRTETEIKQYAQTCRIKQLVWIEADGNPRVEQLDYTTWQNSAATTKELGF